MNTSRKHTAAFTLVELLTVIAIIAILMGLLFPVIGTIKDKARGVEALNNCKQIVNAVKAYYAEYGKYPTASAGAAVTTTDYFASNDANGKSLMTALRAAPAGDPVLTNWNPRLITYLEVPDVKNPNVPVSGLGTDGYFYDPWGAVYRIVMDGDYDGLINNPYTADSGAGKDKLSTGVIVWSLGKDGDGAKTDAAAQGAKSGGTFKDDIISWQ